MMAAELFKKTLAGYEASLIKGDSMTLSKYCRMHHINCRGLRYWMRKHSITTPKITSGNIATRSISNTTDHLVTGSHHMIPILIQPPIREKTSKQTKSSLSGVNITTPNGLVVCLSEISCSDLAELILSCNTR
jgi:hypothetical protein